MNKSKPLAVLHLSSFLPLSLSLSVSFSLLLCVHLESGLFGVSLLTLLEQDQRRLPGTKVPIILQKVRQILPYFLGSCLIFVSPRTHPSSFFPSPLFIHVTSLSHTLRARDWTQRGCCESLEPPPESRSVELTLASGHLFAYTTRAACSKVALSDPVSPRVQALCQELESSFYDGVFPWHQLKQHDAATLLKLFIRELPHPLLTVEYLNTFVAVNSTCGEKSSSSHSLNRASSR